MLKRVLEQLWDLPLPVRQNLVKHSTPDGTEHRPRSGIDIVMDAVRSRSRVVRIHASRNRRRKKEKKCCGKHVEVVIQTRGLSADEIRLLGRAGNAV